MKRASLQSVTTAQTRQFAADRSDSALKKFRHGMRIVILKKTQPSQHWGITRKAAWCIRENQVCTPSAPPTPEYFPARARSRRRVLPCSACRQRNQ